MPRLPDWLSFKDLQRLKCEFIGTFFLCFAYSCKTHMEWSIAPLAVGATYAGVVYAGGPVSGAHYNPATTVALLVRGNIISAKNATLYMLTQALAAICAAVIAGGVFAFSNNAYPTPADDIDDWNAFATEMLFTFMLAFVILHVSTRDEVAGNGYFGLAIGLAYTAALIATGEISGCALNPAIGLLAFINGDWDGAKQAYIYIFGPPIGAAIAGVVFKLTTLVDAAEESGQSAQIVSQGTYVTFMVEAVGTFFVCLVYAFTSPGIHISPLAVGCAYAAMTYAGGRFPEGASTRSWRWPWPSGTSGRTWRRSSSPRRCYCTSRRKSRAPLRRAARPPQYSSAITRSVIPRSAAAATWARRSSAKWSGRAWSCSSFWARRPWKVRGIICTSRWRSVSRSSARGPPSAARRADASTPPSACSSLCRTRILPTRGSAGGAANRRAVRPHGFPVCLLRRRRRRRTSAGVQGTTRPGEGLVCALA